MRLLQTLILILRKSCLLIPVQLLLFLFFYTNINAQGWEKSYPINGYNNLRTEYMALTQDGGFCLTATIDDPSETDIAVMKLDAEGNQQWLQVYGDVFEDQSARIFQLDDGGYMVGGTTANNTTGGNSGSNPDIGDWYMLRLDELGNKLWDQNYGSSASEEFNAFIPSSDNGFLLVGERAGIDRIFLQKIDAVGTEQWISTVGPGAGFSEGRDVKVTSDGGYIITGAHKPLGNDPLFDKNFFTVKVDQNGVEEWSHKHGGIFQESGEEVIETQDGGYACVGFRSWDNTNADLYLVKFNAIGDTLWTQTFGLTDRIERGFTVVEAPSGDLIAFGNSVNSLNNQGFGYVVRTDANGNLIEERILNESSAVGFPGVILPTPDEGFIVAGTGDSIIGLIKTDGDLNSLTNSIQGNVFYDIDTDCMLDNGELDLEEWIVVADGEGNNDYFAFTDSDGNYEILCDTGEFVLKVVSPNELWTMCPSLGSGFGLDLNNFFDTISVDFPMQSVTDCPHMSVDLSAPQLRRCFENTYYVQYCNDGTLPEANAYVEILFDSFLNITTSSLPYNDLGDNLFSFDIGNMEVGECGNFTVNVMVDCDSTVLGQTHCVEAHIYPDSFCIIDSVIWDGSSMEVEGTCIGDSILFSVTNVGTSAPFVPNVVRVVEDDIVVSIQILDLDPNEIQNINVPVGGHTIRLELDQSPGHPGNSNPSVTIEGCGTGNDSLGYVTQFPMDDGNHFIDIDCQENVGSYDPNDKAAYPKGYFDQHYIGAEDELEYHIRFQNTGTDTAFTVVLKDTLSEYLDPTSIRLGSSSHDYSTELLGNGILKFTFDNIMLPDSAANLVESNGYIKFTIRQKEGNLPGTVIENSAGIYFDFNAPVITNTVFHTIENRTNYIVEEIGICNGDYFKEIEILADTVILDTIPEVNAQEIIITAIELLHHSYSESAIVINNGDMVDGMPIFGDTVIIIQDVAYNGCDSLQRVDVTVDIDNPLGFNPNFNIYPNPTSDIFYINYELAERTTVNLTLYDVLGKKIGTVVENELQSSGVKSYKIDEKNIVGNVLFVHWQSGNKNYIQKVIFTTP